MFLISCYFLSDCQDTAEWMLWDIVLAMSDASREADSALMCGSSCSGLKRRTFTSSMKSTTQITLYQLTHDFIFSQCANLIYVLNKRFYYVRNFQLSVDDFYLQFDTQYKYSDNTYVMSSYIFEKYTTGIILAYDNSNNKCEILLTLNYLLHQTILLAWQKSNL